MLKFDLYKVVLKNLRKVVRNFIIENLRGYIHPGYITVLQLLKTYNLMIYSFTKFYRMGAEVLVYFYGSEFLYIL